MFKIYVIVFAIAMAIAIIAGFIGTIIKNKKLKATVNAFGELSVNDFLQYGKNASWRSQLSVSGVYVLKNLNNGKCYVGQAKNIYQRVSSHLSGRGNGDVYADLKYGTPFSIKIIPLSNSGYSSLDDLERNVIALYDSYNTGYNKTRGNRG